MIWLHDLVRTQNIDSNHFCTSQNSCHVIFKNQVWLIFGSILNYINLILVIIHVI